MNLKHLERWLEIQCKEHEGTIICLMFIIFIISISIYINVHHHITIPNQACNECGYGQGIDANPNNLFSSDGYVQCENEKIIYYDTTREIRDKWGNNKVENGFWVTCGGNKQ